MPKERVYRYAPSNYQLNQKLKRMQNNGETKYLDTPAYFSNISATSTYPITTGGTMFALNLIGTGDNQITREGADIRATSLQWKGDLSIPELTQGVEAYNTSLPIYCRMIILWDSQPNGALPPEIVGSPTTNSSKGILDNSVSSAFDAVHLPYNHATVGERYKILFDKTYSFNRATTHVYTQEAEGQFIYPSIKLKGNIKLSRKIQYTGPGNTIASISTNSLICVLISTLPVEDPIANTVFGQICFRMYFKDDS